MHFFKIIQITNLRENRQCRIAAYILYDFTIHYEGNEII